MQNQKDILSNVRKAAQKGNRSTVGLMQQYKSTLPPAAFPVLIDCLKRVLGLNVRNLIAAPRSENEDIFSGANLPPAGIERELQWAVSIILSNQKTIGTYIRVRDEIQKKLMERGPEDALGYTQNLESKNLASLWLLEAKLALSHLSGGADLRTKFIVGIQGQKAGPGPLAKLIIGYVAEKHDEAISLIGFKRRQYQRAESWQLSGSLKSYFLYTIAGEIPAEGELEEWAGMLAFASHGSVIDLYEVILDFLGQYLDGTNLTSVLSKKILGKLLAAGIQDARLNKYLALVSQTYFKKWVEEQPEVFRDTDIKEGLWILEDVFPVSFPSVDTPGKSERKSSIASMISMDLAILQHRISDAEKAGLRLEKLSATLQFTSIGRTLGAITRSLRSTRTESLLTEATLSTRPIHFDPFDVIAASEEVYEDVVNYLVKKCKLHSSSYERFVLGFLATYNAQPLEIEISVDPYFEIGKAHGLISKKEYRDALSLISSIQPGSDKYLIVEVARCRLTSHIRLKEYPIAIKLLADIYISNPEWLQFMPLYQLFFGRVWKELRAIENDPHLALGLTLYTKIYRDDDQETNLRFAVKRLYETKCNKNFSIIFYIDSAQKDIWISTLKDACTPQNLQFISRLGTLEKILEARMSICQSLMEIDELNRKAYEEEIRKITYDLVLKEAVRQFDQTRVFVNKTGIAKWATTELSEAFNYYKSLIETLPIERPKISDVLSKYLNSGDQERKKKLGIDSWFTHIPDTDADKLLVDLIKQIFTRFYLDTDDGLNHYLGARIRHGSLSGHLRSPLVEAGLISKRIGNTEEYSSIESWDLVRYMDEEQWHILNNAIKSFSKKFDDLVDEIAKELIQVKSNEKPLGLIVPSFRATEYHLIQGKITMQTSFEEFIHDVLEYATLSLTDQLEIIRNQFANVLKPRLIALLNELKESCEDLSSEVKKNTGILDKINDGITQLRIAADEVINWFRIEEIEGGSKTYTIEEIVDVAIKVVTNTHRNFRPVITKHISENFPVLNGESVALFTDSLFIVFDNIYMRSGVQPNPIVDIYLTYLSNGFVHIRVENDIVDSILEETSRERLARLKQSITTQSLQQLTITAGKDKESGMAKLRLKAIRAEHLLGKPSVDFGILDDSRFYTDFYLWTISINNNG